MEPSPSSQRGAFIAKLGVWLQVSLVLGVAGILRAVEAFRAIEGRGGDAAQLSTTIDEILLNATISSDVALTGLALVTVAITFCRYRARWLFTFLCFYGLLSFGTSLFVVAWLTTLGVFLTSLMFCSFGVFFLIFAVVKKEEFERVPVPKRKLPSCYRLDP